MPSSRTEVAAANWAEKSSSWAATAKTATWSRNTIRRTGSLASARIAAKTTTPYRRRDSKRKNLHYRWLYFRCRSIDTVYQYDPAADRWAAKKPMPTPRGAFAVGVIAGKIYAAGGVGADGRNTHANEAYDPIQDSWTKHAPMPTARDHHAIGVVDGKLHAIAGRINGSHDRSIGDLKNTIRKTIVGRPARRFPASAAASPLRLLPTKFLFLAANPTAQCIAKSNLTIRPLIDGNTGRRCQPRATDSPPPSSAIDLRYLRRTETRHEFLVGQ